MKKQVVYHAMTAVWSKAPPLTARCLSPLPGFKSRSWHLRKLPAAHAFSAGFKCWHCIHFRDELLNGLTVGRRVVSNKKIFHIPVGSHTSSFPFYLITELQLMPLMYLTDEINRHQRCSPHALVERQSLNS